MLLVLCRRRSSKSTEYGVCLAISQEECLSSLSPVLQVGKKYGTTSWSEPVGGLVTAPIVNQPFTDHPWTRGPKFSVNA